MTYSRQYGPCHKSVVFFFKRLIQKNIKHNKNKLRLRANEVPSVHDLLTLEDLQEDSEKTESCSRLQHIKSLQTFLGMVNYLTKAATTPMNTLLHLYK